MNNKQLSLIIYFIVINFITSFANAQSATEDLSSVKTESGIEAAEADRLPAALSNINRYEISGSERQVRLLLKTESTEPRCFVVEFELVPGESLSCQQSLPLTYKEKSCSALQTPALLEDDALEIGQVAGSVACSDAEHFELRFRTAQDGVRTWMSVIRSLDGRNSPLTRLNVEKSEVESKSEIISAWSQLPQIKFRKAMESNPAPPPSGGVADGIPSAPEESPFKFKFSGYSWFEFENSKGGTSSQPLYPYTSGLAQTSLVGQLTGEVARDQTALVTVIDLGELVLGDSASGADLEQSSRSEIIKVRNFYLSHAFTDHFNFQAGLITRVSDPRSFIFNNHTPTIEFNYNHDQTQSSIWYSLAKQESVDPAVALTDESAWSESQKREEYIGWTGQIGWLTNFKSTLFAVYRSAKSLESRLELIDPATSGDRMESFGRTQDSWLGFQTSYDGADPLIGEINGIYFHENFKSHQTSLQENTNAYLADIKLGYIFSPSLSVTLEGLMTPGQADVIGSISETDANTGAVTEVRAPNFGASRAFRSIADVSYLLTLATSDGADDAAGRARSGESVLAPLSQPEGLQIAIASINWNIGRNWTTILRGGWLSSSVVSGETNSRQMGSEYDLNMIYQISPSTLFDLNIAYFLPGKFYPDPKLQAIHLTTFRMKFAF